MAKEKAFTNPVLEIGVPSYPTPSVPDFYSKSGHIILIERISTNKGSYEPLPLDGSVQYSGKDAGKWPEALYLVAQRPTEDGQQAIRFWANDRSYASQDPWNYNIQYSEDNPDYPAYIRSYVIRRDQYEPFAIGSEDPIFGGTTVVTKQEMKELPQDDPMASLHVAVTVVYEPIPGPALAGAQNKGGLLGLVSTSTQIVDPATLPDTLTLPNDTLKGVIESSVEPLSSTKAKKTTVLSNSPLALDGKQIGEYGLITSHQEINSYAHGIFPDSLTVKLDKEPIDLSKSKITWEKYDDGVSSLVGNQYDEYLNKFVTVSRQLIAAGTSAPTPSSGNMIISSKDDPIDKWKSVRIQSKLTSLPDSRTEYDTSTHSSPLLVFDMGFDIIDLSCGSTSDFRVLVRPNTRAAQSRITTFKTVTSFTYGPPSTSGDTDLFSPVLQNYYYTGLYINFDLGPALCDELIQTQPSYYCGAIPIGSENINISATSPSATEYLSYIDTYKKVSWESKYWRSGVWVNKSVYAKII